MKKEWIVRAWKDPAFRASLSAEERASLPDSPSGRALTELDESELLGITSGRIAGPGALHGVYRPRSADVRHRLVPPRRSRLTSSPDPR